MRTAHYRPEVRNGQVKSRQAARTAVSVGKSRREELTSRRVLVAGRSGFMVMTTIIVAGLVVGTGFVMALQTQNNIYRIGLDDARLKAQLHQISNQQRVESLEQERVINQVEKMALVQPALVNETPREPRVPAAEQVATAIPAKVRLRGEAAPVRRVESGKNSPRAARQLRQPGAATAGAKPVRGRHQVVRTLTRGGQGARGTVAAKSAKAPARNGETRRQR